MPRAVTVPDRLLPRRRPVDCVEGQRDLDKIPAVDGHGPESGRSTPTKAGTFSPGEGVSKLLRMALLLLPVWSCKGRQDEGGGAGVGSPTEAISSEIVTPPNRFANPARSARPAQNSQEASPRGRTLDLASCAARSSPGASPPRSVRPVPTPASHAPMIDDACRRCRRDGAQAWVGRLPRSRTKRPRLVLPRAILLVQR